MAVDVSLPPPPAFAPRVRSTVVVAKVVRIRKALRELHRVVAGAPAELHALFVPVYLRAVELAGVGLHLSLEADRLRVDLDAARAKRNGAATDAAAFDEVGARLDTLATTLESTISTVVDARAQSATDLGDAARVAAADLDLLAAAAGEVELLSRS